MEYNEIFSATIPFVIVSFFLLFLGTYLKKSYNSKKQNSVKAKVVEVEIKTTRNNEGYLLKKEYVLTLEYLYNGRYVLGKTNSIYDYDIDSYIDITLLDDKVYEILGKKSNSTFDDHKSLDLKGYQFVLGIGYFFLGFTFLSVISNILLLFSSENVDLSNYFLLLIYVGLIILFVYIIRKQEEKLKVFSDGTFTKMNVRIVDVKKESRYDDGKTHTYYYPIIEYPINGNYKTKVIYDSGIVDEKNKPTDMYIYIDRRTGEIKKESKIKEHKVVIFILKILIVIISIICVFMLLNIFR